MAITTMDGLVAALGASPDVAFSLASVTNVAGGWVAVNTTAGNNNIGTLATPTVYSSGGSTYSNLNSSPVAGFPTWTPNAGGSAQTYLGKVSMESSSVGTFYLYDLLWACSGMSGTVTTAQAVSSFSGMPTRNSTGSGAELWLWCFTALGSTSANVTCSYTNSGGTSSRTSISTATGTSLPASRIIQLPLQSGDTGIKQVASVTLSASTGTAGSFGVAIMQRIAAIPLAAANIANVYDFTQLGMPSVSDNACILFVNHSTTTSSGTALGMISLVQG